MRDREVSLDESRSWYFTLHFKLALLQLMEACERADNNADATGPLPLVVARDTGTRIDRESQVKGTRHIQHI